MIPPFSKQQQYNQQLQIHLTVANTSHSCNSSPHQNPTSFRKSALVPHMLRMLHVLHVSDVLKEKDIRRKSNGFELLPPPTGRSPSLDEGGLGVSPVKASGLAVDCL